MKRISPSPDSFAAFIEALAANPPRRPSRFRRWLRRQKVKLKMLLRIPPARVDDYGEDSPLQVFDYAKWPRRKK